LGDPDEPLVLAAALDRQPAEPAEALMIGVWAAAQNPEGRVLAIMFDR
jgi:hypothetical protein